jgi:polyisoprenoid-binding protein YceI
MKLPVELKTIFAGSIWAICSQAVFASEWTLVPETSAVTMYATKQGAWITGVFKEFSAGIDFDTADPGGGKITGVVVTGSVDTQDAQNDAYVIGYLNVVEHPESRFESSAIETTAEGYRAVGELNLAGHSNPAVLDFSFSTGSVPSATSDRAKLVGTMTINRFDYEIAGDIDTNVAGQDVIVRIELDLSREP